MEQISKELELRASPFNWLLTKNTRRCFSWIIHGSNIKTKLQYKDKRVKNIQIKQPFQYSNRGLNFEPTTNVSSKGRIKIPVLSTNNTAYLKRDNIKSDLLERIRSNYVHEMMGESNSTNTLMVLLTRRVMECFYKSLFDEIMMEEVNLNQLLLQLGKELSSPTKYFSSGPFYLEHNKQPSLSHSIFNHSDIPHSYSVNRINSEWHRIIENPQKVDKSALEDRFRLSSNSISKWKMINATSFNTTPRYYYHNRELIHPNVPSNIDKTRTTNKPKIEILRDETIEVSSTEKTRRGHQTVSSYSNQHFTTPQNQPTSQEIFHKDRKNKGRFKESNNESEYNQEHKKLKMK